MMTSVPISVSQQPRAPQRHSPAPRVDDHVADLARVAALPRHRPPAAEQAAADPHVGRDVDEVVVAAGRSAGVLAERAQVRVVADGDRHL